MGVVERFWSLTRRGRLGLELGTAIAAVELHGADAAVAAAQRADHPGLGDVELGQWLRRWLHGAGFKAKSANVVIVGGDVHHYLVTMPEMSDGERHLAAGAEVRRLAPGPAAQLAYSHMAVGVEDESGLTKQKVMISAVDRTTMRSAMNAVAAAGLEPKIVTTVPAALVKAAGWLPEIDGGTALAYLSSDRCYLIVLQGESVELVRDFTLRDGGGAEAVAAELRRSFLYFGQRAKGATVDRLVLAGPMAGLADLSAELGQSLGIDVDAFGPGAETALPAEALQPELAAALGAASLQGDSANLVPPEQIAEGRVGRFFSFGRVAAAVVLVLLLGWGLLALLDSLVQEREVDDMQAQVAAARTELAQAQAIAQERADHAARRAMLQERSLESTLMGAMMQRVALRVPDSMVIEAMDWVPSVGPGGERHWDVELGGLVLGSTRTESQAAFNRFYSLLASDPLTHDVHLVEPLVIGVEIDDGATRSTLDEMSPPAPNRTSVQFKIRVQLKSIAGGGER